MDLHKLYETLDKRPYPEDVAKMIMDAIGNKLTASGKATLKKAAKPPRFRYMSDDFARVRPMDKQLNKTRELLEITMRHSITPPKDCLDMSAVHAFVDAANAAIAKTRGQCDFKDDRLNGKTRKANPLLKGLSRRRYNKLFRLLCRLEDKERKTAIELEKRGLTQVSKSRLASKLSYEEFVAHDGTAAFIAYYAAKCNQRSLFTVAGQQNPYDEIADMLFKRLTRSRHTNWYAVAHVYPTPNAVAELTDEQQGEMLGKWFDVMTRTARLLRGVWDNSDINRETMTVKRGNDSTTWNVMAGAWNKAREGWIAFVYALGFDPLLEQFCPGKCMRLIAGDVANWHAATGHTGDPNQKVWCEIPLPWEVLEGEDLLGRNKVIEVCKKHGLDPEKSGWVAPRPAAEPRPFTPTPELVHGVAVSSPELATVLRKAGYFSGQPAKKVVEGVEVERDEHGFATGAKPAKKVQVKRK